MNKRPRGSLLVLSVVGVMAVSAACSDEASPAGQPPVTGAAGAAGAAGAGAGQGGSAGAAPTACGAPKGEPVVHASGVAQSETWAAGAVHVVDAPVEIAPGATLTIEPCVEVRVAKGARLRVLGNLVAKGAEGSPIRFVPKVAGELHDGVAVESPGFADLAYVVIEGGGGSGDGESAALFARGDGLPSKAPVRVSHVTLSGSGAYGAYLRSWAGFAEGSSDLVIEKSGQADAGRGFPVRMSLNAVSTLPPGKYTGNAVDAVQLVGESPHYTVEVDETFRSRGVPYLMGGPGGTGELQIGSAQGESTVTLTVEAGVTVAFGQPGGALRVGVSQTKAPVGRLVAKGAAGSPVVFTSPPSANTPGAWRGIVFEQPIAAGNALDGVRIEYAGGESQAKSYGCNPSPDDATVAALTLFARPEAAFLTNSTVADSASHGVFSAWSGAEVDFGASNTFTNVPGCKQVAPKDEQGKCPDKPACQL